MDVGRTNKRITLYRVKEITNDLLQKEQALTAVKTVWASLEPMRGKEYQEAQRIRSELTYKITIRYIDNITADMLVKYKDRYFEIVSQPINPREKNEMLEIICIEKIQKKKEGANGLRMGE